MSRDAPPSSNTLGVPSFPARGSPQVASSSGRSASLAIPSSSPMADVPTRPNSARSSGSRGKVGLKPGHSLMDWIRLTKSGKDLAGTKGQLQKVTLEELSRHNKEEDCWVSFRGLVYNMTPYLDYHPGGVEELMRAAGSDGSQLFDEIHPWVNLESMISATLVGKLVSSVGVESTTPRNEDVDEKMAPPVTSSSGVSSLFPPDSLSTKRSSTATTSSSTASSATSSAPLRSDWFQNEARLHLVVSLPSRRGVLQPALRPCDLVISHDAVDDRFRVDALLEDGVATLEWRLHSGLDADEGLEFRHKTGGCRVELLLTKSQPRLHWTSFGTPTERHLSFASSLDPEATWRVTIASSSRLNHNCFRLRIRLPALHHLAPPPGAHVFLRRRVDEGKVSTRPYTPVEAALLLEEDENDDNNDNSLLFLVKSYSSGEFTKTLADLSPGHEMEIGAGWHGNAFAGMEEFPESCRRVCLLAAGTGITPMTGIISQLLNPSSPPPSRSTESLHLIFFNRTEEDILLHSTWSRLCDAYPERFLADHILSDADASWTGRRGHVSARHVRECLASSSPESVTPIRVTAPDSSTAAPPTSVDDVAFVVCGSPEFNVAAESALEELGVGVERVHVFA